MQAMATWFGGASAPDKEPSAPTSLASEWKQYSASSSGPSPGKLGTSQSDRLLASAEEGAASVTRLVSGAFGAVAGGVAGAASSVSTGVQNVPGTTQWVYFAALAGAGGLFLLLAFTIFLPVIILAPSKFALTFTIGSALILASMGALRGWRSMFGHLASKERAPFTAAYAGSLLGTLYAALFMHSYIFSLVFCGAQVVTLIYFVASYFPGGVAGAQYTVGAVGRGMLSVGGSVARGVLS